MTFEVLTCSPANADGHSIAASPALVAGDFNQLNHPRWPVVVALADSRAMGMSAPEPTLVSSLPNVSAPASSVIQVPKVKVPVLSLDNTPAELHS
ncbi:hypothetical protein TCAL_15190 [Tigriopus californicus]|uniref:Uncharacterized protein n=1 Tax=Tigriopus californicus TaxID=6832 RepID=A0A553NED9_TIGCA|nr:hypothetical protein TCAL_15190 [Tigriopus californicus]